MKHTIPMQILHPLRHFKYHPNRLPKIPRLQPLQIRHQISISHIRANKKPRWVPTSRTRSQKRQTVNMTKRFPDSHFVEEEFLRCGYVEYFDGDGVGSPGSFVDVGEEHDADFFVQVDFVSGRKRK